MSNARYTRRSCYIVAGLAVYAKRRACGDKLSMMGKVDAVTDVLLDTIKRDPER